MARARRRYSPSALEGGVGGGSNYRGSVRDVTTGAFRGFRDWSDLVAFMVARIEERPRAEEVRDVGR